MKIQNVQQYQSFQGKRGLKFLNSTKIKTTVAQDCIILENKSLGTKVEVITFPREKIRELQEIAEKIYTRKSLERNLSNKIS